MPELPEVETARAALARAAAGHRITAVGISADSIFFERTSPARLRRALVGRRVEAVSRRGKHLWMELDERPWPCFHLGMTGAFHFHRVQSDRPRFWKLELVLDHGLKVTVTNKRRLGRVRLREDPPSEEPIRSLGFDPLTDMPSVRAFSERVLTRRCPLKALLLDQSFAAGVGNWIADEVLYQSRLSPHRRGTELTTAEARRLHGALRRVVCRAVDVDADADRFPRAWLFHTRWGRKAGAVTPRGEVIRFDDVAGRTTAWVPAVQS